MSDEALDAESKSRTKNNTAAEHLAHLLRVGHKPNSVTIREFVRNQHLEDTLQRLIDEMGL